MPVLKRFFDSPIVVTATRFAAKGIGAVAVAVLARALGEANYGEFVFLTGLISTILSATVGPVDTLVARYGSDPERPDARVRTILLRGTVLLTIPALALFGLAVLGVDNPVRSWEPWLIAAGALALPLRGGAQVLEAYHTARKRFDVAQIARVLEAVGWVGALALAWASGWLDLRLVVVLFLARQAAAALLLGVPYLSSDSPSEPSTGTDAGGQPTGSGSRSPGLWSRFRSDFIQLYPNALFAMMVATADTVMLGYLSTEVQTGLYGVAGTVFGGMMLLPNGINYYLRSRTGERTFFRDGNYHRYCRLGFASAAVLGLACAAGAPWIVRVLAGSGFEGAVVPLQILAAALVARSAAVLFASLWLHLERYRLISMLTAANGILNVALNFWVIPRYGATGAAVTSLISYSIGFTLNFVLLARLGGRPRPLHAYFVPTPSDVDLLREHLRSLR